MYKHCRNNFAHYIFRKVTMDKTENICSCGELHKGHICYLTNMGMLREVHHLSDKPAVTCGKCGAKANLAHNVCFPGQPAE